MTQTITLAPGQSITIQAAATTPAPAPSTRKLIATYVIPRDFTGVGDNPNDPGIFDNATLAYLGDTLQLKGFMVDIGGLDSLSNEDWSNPTSPTQAAFASSNIVARCAAHGITKLYAGLGTPDPNLWPFAPWTDDAAWTAICAKLTAFVAALKRMGFAGIWFDHETGAWGNSVPGLTVAIARVQALHRGMQCMRALVAGFMGIEVVNYSTKFNGGYSVAIRPGFDPDATELALDFHDGMTSIPGWSKYRFANADFYLGDPAAMASDVAGVEADLAAHWGGSARGVQEVPFVWLGPSEGDGGTTYTAQHIDPAGSLARAQAAYLVSPDEFYCYLAGNPQPIRPAHWSAYIPSTPVTWPTPGDFEPAWLAGAGQ